MVSFLSSPAHAIWTCVTPEEAVERAADHHFSAGNPAYCRLNVEHGQAFDPGMKTSLCQVWLDPVKKIEYVLQFTDLNGNMCVIKEQHVPA